MGGGSLDSGYMKQIRERILSAEDGTIFATSDFADVADSATVRQSLNRLVQAGILRRVLRGIFEKPKYSSVLNEFVEVNPDAVAKTLARTYHWTIAPCGNTALNFLGLSTQVTATWSYISDGPYRIYEWDSTKIEFKHRANREITGLSYITVLVVQALKILGKDNVTPEIIRILSGRLDSKDKVLLLKESAEATDWVHDIIKNI